MDNGKSYVPLRGSASAKVQISNAGSNPDPKVPALYDTEMLSLSLSGSGLPQGFMLRESPTLQSQGGTAIKRLADGTYQISSFFDIFPEVSLDSGTSWMPAQAPTHVELQCNAPEQNEPSPN